MKKSLLLSIIMFATFSSQLIASTEVDFSNKVIWCNTIYFKSNGNTGESGIYASITEHESEAFKRFSKLQSAKNIFADNIIKVMVFGNIYDSADKSMEVNATITDIASNKILALSEATIQNDRSFTLKTRLSDNIISENPTYEWVKLSCKLVDSGN